MSVKAYNAIVRYSPNMAGKYRAITNVAGFIRNMQSMYDAHTIFFYDTATRLPAGFWKRGMSHHVHQPRARP